jgi:hypothetical protein
VTLLIVERTREQADEYILLAEKYLQEMNESGYYMKDIIENYNNMLNEYNSTEFLNVEKSFFSLEEIYKAAFDVDERLQLLRENLDEAEYNGVSAVEAKKMYFLAETIFKRGDYVSALAKLKEAEVMFLLETKGKFNLYYQIKNNPVKSTGIFALVAFLSFSTFMVGKRTYLKRKIKMLNKEEELILQLMKVVQRETFEEARLSMNEYLEAMQQYEKMLGESIKKRIRAESQLNNLMKFKGKKKSLEMEKSRITEMIKGLQDDYLNKGTIETRVYQNMLKTYAAQLSKVQEELVNLDARKALKGAKL